MGTIRNTKRPLNRCTSCGKTWYPRGSNLSSRCPKCGSDKTKLAGLGILGAVGSILIGLVMSGHSGNQNGSANSAVATQMIQSANDATIMAEPHVSSVSTAGQFGSLASSPAFEASAPTGVAAVSEVAQTTSPIASMAEPEGSVAAGPEGRGAGSGAEANGATFSHH